MAELNQEPTPFEAPEEKPTVAASKGRGWVFRGAALIIGLMPLVIAEGVLRIGGWGAPNPQEDPFVGFSSVRPLFALNADETEYEIAPSRRDWFYPVTFPATKGENTVRIFCLGGSTVAGRPYTAETAFSTFLQLYLKDLDPETDWEVINCGGVSYASYRLVPIMEEVLANYEPDLIVLYTGHNEFLEDRTYEHIKNLPAVVTRPYELASNLHAFNLMRRAYLRVSGQVSPSVMEARPIMPEEVDALLEHKGGMEHYYRDEAWHQSVIEHFEFNLDRLCGLANEAAVPMIVMNPASNIRDIRPFKSEHRGDLSDSERREVENLINKAAQAFGQTQTERAALLYEAALDIDPLYADTHYQYGRLMDLLNDLKPAHDAYVRAKDLDVCPLRMLEPMHQVLKEVVDRHQVVWLDSRQEVKKVAEAVGIPGNDQFLDHVHPNPGGHMFFAKLLVERMGDLGFLRVDPGWFTAAGPMTQKHMDSLRDDYWVEGEMRLLNLKNWARGRSEAEPEIESKRRKPENP